METKVTLLTHENYDVWKRDIKVTLMDQGSYGFIDKSEKEPPEDGSLKLKKGFALRRDCAYTTIYSSISPEYRTLISSTTDWSLKL